MNFDITRLNNNIDKSIFVDEVYSFSKDELLGTDLLKLDDVKIEGEIFKNSLGNIELGLDVSGIMVLPCAITLKPVDYPFSTEINGEIEELMADFEENSTKLKNTIDILPIIWENILLEIPMRVISDEAKDKDFNLSGDGWEFVSDDNKTNNPLKSLLDYDEDSEVK